MLRASFLAEVSRSAWSLLREGDEADFLHVVVDGKVEVFSAYRDRETTVSVLGPGHCFITAAVVLDRVYLKSARSLTAARVLLIPADAVRRCFSEDAAFARCLACDLAASYRMVVKELKNQKLRSGLERLANWLLAHRAELGNVGRFELPFEKKVLAARLGMAPEVLSRSFAALAPYKVKVAGPSSRSAMWIHSPSSPSPHRQSTTRRADLQRSVAGLVAVARSEQIRCSALQVAQRGDESFMRFALGPLMKAERARRTQT